MVDVNDHAPEVEVVFLGADDEQTASSGRVSRHARTGDPVARVSISDADRLDNVTVSLHRRPGNYLYWLRDGNRATSEPFHSDAGPFLLTSRGDGVYVVTLASELTDLWYRLEIIATDSGSLTTSAFLDVFVDDEDHPDALSFTQTIYCATLFTDTLPGSCVTAVQLTGDHGQMMSYHRLDNGDLDDVLYVGRRNGRVCTRSWLPCDTPTVVRLAIVATDWSDVSLRSLAVAVELTIDQTSSVVSRVNFESGFYSADVDEDVPVGSCVLTVSRLSGVQFSSVIFRVA